MKTYKEWYKELPKPYKQMAIEAFDEQKIDEIEDSSTIDSLARAITSGFLWNDTKQGDAFWSRVCSYAMGVDKSLPVLELEV